MTRDTQRARSEAGFTLAEIIVSLFILAFATSALMLLSTRSTAGATTSRDRSVATMLASQKVEELSNEAFDDLVAGAFDDGGTIGADGTASGPYFRNWTISDATVVGSDAKVIAVTVSWAGGKVSLQTQRVESAPVLGAGWRGNHQAVTVRSWTQES